MADDIFLIFLGLIPWVLFLIVVLKSNSIKKNRKRTLYKLYLFVFFFAAIRYGIGYDYFGYKSIIEGNAPEYELQRFEILPRYLALISGQIHYQVYFAVCSFLTIWPVYFVSKKLSIDPLYSFLVYVLFPMFFLDSLSITRNAVAYSMVFLMFYCIYNKKLVYSFFFFLVAIAFHTSAAVAILIYPFYWGLHNKKLHLILYLVSFVLPIVVMPILETYFSDFELVVKLTKNIEKDNFKVGGMLYYVFNTIAIVNLVYWKKLVSFREDNKYYLTYINVGVVLWNTFLSIDSTTACRLSMFFLLFLVLLMPSFFHIIRRPSMRMAIKAFFVLLFISSLTLDIYGYFGKQRNMSNVPYQVFFLFPSNHFYHI